jgi:hypothetical protein
LDKEQFVDGLIIEEVVFFAGGGGPDIEFSAIRGVVKDVGYQGFFFGGTGIKEPFLLAGKFLGRGNIDMITGSVFEGILESVFEVVKGKQPGVSVIGVLDDT